LVVAGRQLGLSNVIDRLLFLDVSTMHIADGLLSPEVCAMTGVVSAGAVGYSLYRLRDSLASKTVPLTGMMSAMIFAGQMVNFPLGTPVSGHLMGGVLASAVLGPWAGLIAMTLVLFVQCAVFADGGWLALGANILHMGVIGSWGGYAVYSLARKLLGDGARGAIAGSVIAAWLSVMAAAALFCPEFWLSHVGRDHASEYPFANIFTLMISFHSLIGIGEAIITGFIVSFVYQQRPDLLYRPDTEPTLVAGTGRFLAAGTITALVVAAFLAPFASEHPDGLEAVAEKIGFDVLSSENETSLLSDYELPMMGSRFRRVSVSIAGIGGTLTVLLIALAFGRLTKPLAPLPEASRE
jgi:cobalt/nickel transport system permease protein